MVGLEQVSKEICLANSILNIAVAVVVGATVGVIVYKIKH